MKNLNKTKNSLKIAFSVIVFITILILGLTYFTTKYIHEIGNEKENFNIVIDTVGGKNFKFDSIGNGPRFELVDGHHMGQGGGRMGIRMTGMGQGFGFNTNGFINYILIDNQNKIISNNIKDDIPEKILLDSVIDDKYFDIVNEGGFLVKKVILQDAKIFVAYKKLSYSLSNYYNDIIGFLLVVIFFTIIVYFIGNKFVNNIFIPVEKNLNDMSDFIHNAGHELKTPIAVVDSNIQMMLETKKFDKEMLLEQKREVLKLNELISSLVNLSDVDIYNDTDELNIKDLINEVLNDLQNEIKNKKIKIINEISEDIIIKANKNYFYMLISNIIKNAIKYNKEKGEINISLNNRKLSIKDTGIGIKEENLEKVFDRFFKADESRNSEGFGIGLSLVKKIAQIYNWKLKINSNINKGTEFIVKF